MKQTMVRLLFESSSTIMKSALSEIQYIDKNSSNRNFLDMSYFWRKGWWKNKTARKPIDTPNNSNSNHVHTCTESVLLACGHILNGVRIRSKERKAITDKKELCLVSVDRPSPHVQKSPSFALKFPCWMYPWIPNIFSVRQVQKVVPEWWNRDTTQRPFVFWQRGRDHRIEWKRKG